VEHGAAGMSLFDFLLFFLIVFVNLAVLGPMIEKGLD
jgi:hypothetical protein